MRLPEKISMNKYRETVQYLFDLQYSGIKMGLQNISKLLEFEGNPHLNWPSVHIAGTNGKGSTAAFVYSILKEAGYRVGLYTSPHLVDFSERIRINDNLIPWETIVDYTRHLYPAIEEVKPTFFEATTAIAFRYFSEQKVDIAVVETGLGGRLDSTNVVTPLVSLISPVSMEHQQYLGDTLEKIGTEKAGIIKPGIPCITTNGKPEVLKILERTCTELKSPLFAIDPAVCLQIKEESITGSHFDIHLGEDSFSDAEISLAGRHQAANALLAYSGIKHLTGFPVAEDCIRSGLKNARWRARMEIIRQNPLTLLDVSHNPAGFERTFTELKKYYPYKKIWAILGLIHDKDFKAITDTIKRNVDEVALVDNFSEKALSAEILKQEFFNSDIHPRQFPDVHRAYSEFSRAAGNDDILIITGSHYLAGEFLQKIQIS